MRRPVRLLAWFRVLLLLGVVLGVGGPAAPAFARSLPQITGGPPTTVETTRPAGATPSGAGVGAAEAAPQDVVGLRTRTSRTYRTGHGYQAVIATGSVNYQDSAGAWQPIDDTLVPATTPGDAYQNKANAYTALLPATLGAPVTVRRGKGSVSFALVGAGGTLTAQGDTATYAAALPHVDVAYQARADALQETLTLQSAAAPATYTYTLRTSGLTATANASGGIDFLDGQGRVQLSMVPPVLQDSSPTDRAVSRSASLTLGPDAASLVLRADPAWLADPARVYPVLLDPGVVLNTDGQCTIANGPDANQNLCALSTFNVGNDGSSVWRSLVEFDTAAIPAQSTVLDADLALYQTATSGGGNPPVDAMQVTQLWGGGGVPPVWWTVGIRPRRLAAPPRMRTG